MALRRGGGGIRRSRPRARPRPRNRPQSRPRRRRGEDLTPRKADSPRARATPPRSGRILPFLSLAALAAIPAGCGTPSKANIELRKQNQSLARQLSDLQQQYQLQGNVLRAYQERQPTTPTLPPAELAKLFTTHGIEFGKLTGPTDPTNRHEKQGFVVYVYPVDQYGQRFKAAGSFVVEAFDLADAKNPLLGRWTFPRDQDEKLWSGFMVFDYYYVLNCPWQERVPTHSQVLIRVTFTDQLTQLPFTAQTTIKVPLPPPPLVMPSTAPATRAQ